MSPKTCPDCRAEAKQAAQAGFPPLEVAPAGDHPAGRCDYHHEVTEARKAACVDCLAEGRPLAKCLPIDPKAPGRRCRNHGRAERKRRAKAAHTARMASHFELEPGDYDRLYRAQGGRCFGCQVATGARKRLAVDHDHQCTAGHDPKKGCYLCIRALLCGQCNQILGRYGVEKLRRLIEVIEDPPARKVLLDS